MKIKAAKEILVHGVARSALVEMAMKKRGDDFEPGWRMFARKDEEGGGPSKYVVGRRTGEKEEGLYPVHGNTVSERSVLPDGLTAKKVIQKLIDAGYKDVTDQTDLMGGTASYYDGEKPSGTVVLFSGKLYHGTEDLEFLSTAYDSTKVGRGSHLQSLNDGDALSLTPDFSIAEGFSEGIMVVEFEARDMKVYRAGLEEDDLDEIDLDELGDVDGVALPAARFGDEKEIALVKWDNGLSVKAVHLKVGSSWRRYVVDQSHVVNFGEWSSFLGKWMGDIYGHEFVDRLIDDFVGAEGKHDWKLGDRGGWIEWSNGVVAVPLGSPPSVTHDALDKDYTDLDEFERDLKEAEVELQQGT
jgi:hypothetical protein